MPRFFFHTHIGREVIADPTGTELRDADHAWEVARDTIQATMAESEAQARLMGAILVVTDEAGETVLEFPFSEVVTLAPEEPAPTVH
ncbi:MULTISPECIES: DUF6894 family protein [Methylobacterium]|uniref:DUF6894 domain-containing protein n=1 Tax=Methylobacterium bullatum TaxID=570505 RepID=A0AAV4Z3J3_9HYPH|nr:MULTISPECIES: hypothetical protein [Methylobacterium]KQO46015.1 hypothetical protein ASF08_06185 [Methylobacterium sp. Leaf85]KQP40424.1 hypothetical protein ASF34_11510 [Methylobacterium sp. Leaf106]MBD8902000.1 hypothetical protein [Methylobacterium bullatum]TXN33296.1 hypothetical protein FV220_03100 [Methylobacterium sp. WL19]GJD38644.1 hypothetical protein OICFNHDK_1089 [Methylobacterium bullatum]